jgi:N-acetylglutamate synthase-like GNAT family acetyltransferase
MVLTRPATPADRDWVAEAARHVLGDEFQVHSRRQFNVLDGDVLVAEHDGRRVGFASWMVDEEGAEVLALACTERDIGAGTALMHAVEDEAARRDARRVHLVTTDANVGAQRFYERLGYALAERRVGAVDECRTRYKAGIPADMHDELVYELRLR